MAKIIKKSKKTITGKSRQAGVKKAVKTPNKKTPEDLAEKTVPDTEKTAKSSSTANRQRSWIIGIMALVMVLVIVEVTVLLKKKAERYQSLTQIGTIAKRGDRNLPEGFIGTMLGKIDVLGRYLHVDENWQKILVLEAATGKFYFAVDKHILQQEQFQPRDVMGDAEGNIYILDRSQVVVVSPQGKFLSRWEVPNAGALNIAKDGNILITDGARKAIVIYSPAGEELGSFGSRGGKKVRLVSPGRLDIDGQGNIYVLDSGTKQVKVFSSAGKFKHSWKLKFQNFGNSSIDVQDKKIYINDFSGNFIWVYSLSGKLIWQIKEKYPGSVSVDESGKMYLAAPQGIGRFELN